MNDVEGITQLSQLAELLPLFQLLSQWLLILAFFSYGCSCFISPALRREFQRYQLPQMRILTGTLQIAAAVGLLVGLEVPLLRILSAGGLALMMLCALIVRIRIRDPWYAALPAVLLGGISAFVALGS